MQWLKSGIHILWKGKACDVLNGKVSNSLFILGIAVVDLYLARIKGPCPLPQNISWKDGHRTFHLSPSPCPHCVVQIAATTTDFKLLSYKELTFSGEMKLIIL